MEDHGTPFRIVVGDSLDVMRDMDNGSVDCVIADPPYVGMGFERPVARYWVRIHPYIEEMRRVSTDDRVAISQPPARIDAYRPLLPQANVLKVADGFADHRGEAAHFLTFNAVTGHDVAAEHWPDDVVPASDHENARDVNAMATIVKAMSRPGDTVLDPFCGSAAIGVACLLLGRGFIGIEMDEGRAADAQRRLAAAASTRLGGSD